MLIWGITGGAAGMQSQVRGLGEALAAATGAQFELHTMKRHPWLDWLPGWCTLGCTLPPIAHAPDVVISCGRRSVAFTLAFKKQHGSRIVHLQNPRISLQHFDVVVAQEHDGLSGANVVTTIGTLHGITQEKLTSARAQFPTLDTLPHPRIAVLIGGNTNRYQVSQAAIDNMVAQIKRLNGSLMITTSRRTPAKMVGALHALKPAYFYEGQGENPYLALLASADEIAVTNDSVSMMSEAAFTQKPMRILAWHNHTNTIPARFSERIQSVDIHDEREKTVQQLIERLRLDERK